MKKLYSLKNRFLSYLLTVSVLLTLHSFPALAEGTEGKISAGDEVYVGGMPFGIKLYTDGLLVVGFSPVDCDSGSTTPASDAGLTVGDVIIEINGKKTTTTVEFADTVGVSEGELQIKYLRHGEEHTATVKPSLSKKDGRYKTGMWLRDSTAGIGTVTFTIPETMEFAGLGHGVCDGETGELIPLQRGVAAEAKISGIKKGTPGTPGELRGYFTGADIGTIQSNTSCGVFGVLSKEVKNPLMPDKVCIASRSEVKLGEADIYCTLEGDEPLQFKIKILRLPEDSSNFEIEVCDASLLEKTGGIVQGMSGSPIIQNGKLVGAVTHVLVNDPTKGYGIFIENMLVEAEKIK